MMTRKTSMRILRRLRIYPTGCTRINRKRRFKRLGIRCLTLLRTILCLRILMQRKTSVPHLLQWLNKKLLIIKLITPSLLHHAWKKVKKILSKKLLNLSVFRFKRCNNQAYSKVEKRSKEKRAWPIYSTKLIRCITERIPNVSRWMSSPSK